MSARLQIKYIEIDKLIPYANNAKIHSDFQIGKIADSINELGFKVPLIVDVGNVVIGGHARILAAKQVGLKELPTISADDLTPAQVKALRLADNRLPEIGTEWDYELVKLDLQELDDLDFDIDFTGFGDLDFSEMKQGLTDDDAIPEAPETPVTVEGDLWILGNHRLLCGDSTSIDDVERLMNGEKANLLMTSPPYWVGKDYETQENEKEIDQFVVDIVSTSITAMKKDFSRIVINSGTGMGTRIGEEKSRVILIIDKWINQLNINNWLLRNIRHWIKCGGSAGPISAKTDYVYSGMEYLMTFYYSDGQQRGQNKINESWCQQSNWGDIKGDKQENTAGFPVELPFRFISLYSLDGDIVFDPFGGNGTTIIACLNTGRDCRMMELDPKYCDVIVKRWQDFTGQQAPLKVTDVHSMKWQKGQIKPHE